MQKRMRTAPAYQDPKGFYGGYKYGSITQHVTNKSSVYRSAQITSSEGHPYRQLGKGIRDIGGPFETRKFSSDIDWTVHDLSVGGGVTDVRYYSRTPIFPGSSTYAVSVPRSEVELRDAQTIEYHFDHRAGVPSLSSSSELDAWGASVIASVLPTNPVADSATFVAELIAERKLFSVPGKAGSLPGEYLNYMFGISPTIGMVRDLRRALSDADKILHQYVRDSGRLVRRRYEPPATEDVKTDVVSDVPPVVLAPYGSDPRLVSTGTLRRTTRTYNRYWFSGAFTYYLPKEGIGRRIDELDKLYGVVPDSSIAWELLPFSWLVDYKLSIGNVLKNLSAFSQDGLVMPYAYVMHHQRRIIEEVWTGHLRYNGTWTPVTLRGSVTTESKQRRPANPFGFGILPGELTPRQLSIIAALGLTLR